MRLRRPLRRINRRIPFHRTHPNPFSELPAPCSANSAGAMAAMGHRRCGPMGIIDSTH
jgi:hypothetical protein